MPKINHVLVTGGAGHIGQLFLHHYGDRYRLRLTDRTEIPVPDGEAETVVADLADFDAVMAAMDGVDGVVHLAADTRIFAPWDSVLPNNLAGTYHVFEAARRRGVRKVVYASSHHACGYALGEAGACGAPAGEDAPVRPDGLYGVSKVFGEALGRLYADRHGLSVVCLRIGWCHGAETDAAQADMVDVMKVSNSKLPYGGREQVGLWISGRDMTQLIHRGLQAAVDYGIYYAASDNDPTILDITRAREELGYAPQDSVNEYLEA
jgi:nucleoside-diphosphate-sugar epimerase